VTTEDQSMVNTLRTNSIGLVHLGYDTFHIFILGHVVCSAVLGNTLNNISIMRFGVGCGQTCSLI